MPKRRIAALLFVCAAAVLFAQSGEPDGSAPDSAEGERAYDDTGFGNSDFDRSLRATMRGEDLYKAGRYDEALEEFNQAVELMPDRMYAAWIGRGNLYYYIHKDYERALADYTEVIRRVPEDYVPYEYEFIRRSAPGQVFFAYYGRANVYGALGEHEKAIVDYTAAIELWPKHSSPWLFRASSYAALGEDDKAIEDYTRVIALGTEEGRPVAPLNLAAAYIERAELYKKGRRYEEALADYGEAIRRGGPNLSIAYGNRGIVHRLMGEPALAMADYDEALRINPDYAEAYNNRGNVYFDLGDYDRAIADYDEALRLKADYVTAYNNRGFTWYKKNDYVRARADFEQALRIDPGYVLAWNNLEKLEKPEDQDE
jgi:tetratricopeptide (TPR) repeat protein